MNNWLIPLLVSVIGSGPAWIDAIIAIQKRRKGPKKKRKR